MEEEKQLQRNAEALEDKPSTPAKRQSTISALLKRKQSKKAAAEEKKKAESDYIASMLMTKQRQVKEKHKNETFGTDQFADEAVKKLLSDEPNK